MDSERVGQSLGLTYSGTNYFSEYKGQNMLLLNPHSSFHL